MPAPVFVDLQGFLVGRHFVVKEFAALKEGHVLSHYIFRCPYPWDILTKSERHQAMWLLENRHGIHWEDGMVPYCMAEDLITKAVRSTTTTNDDDDDDDADDGDIVVYVKGREKREWLRDLLLDEARRAVHVENIEEHYEDIESLNKLNVKHTFRCQKHIKNCALQNVFKLFNWWHHHHHK